MSDMPEMDYSKLLGKMREYGYSQKGLAESAEISESQFCQKLAGNYPFKQKDIKKICDLLDIRAEEIGAYFVSPKS